ncbi:hypothetical protein U3516DRAFT_913115 [Neocallimastix sp. 'constans']
MIVFVCHFTTLLLIFLYKIFSKIHYSFEHIYSYIWHTNTILPYLFVSLILIYMMNNIGI